MFTKVQIVGILVFVVLGTAVTTNAANLVTNPGFETYENTSGGPSGSYGDWNGDYSAIVDATSGVTPMSGSKMLQFKGTSHVGYAYSNACHIFQVINISDYHCLIAAGQGIAQASMYLNRISGDSQTDTQFNLHLMAFDGTNDTFPSRWESYTYSASIGHNYVTLQTDSSPESWQICSVSLHLPVDTTFVVLAISANEDIYNDYSSTEFDGHFTDNAFVQIVPEQATMLLLGLGVLAVRRKQI